MPCAVQMLYERRTFKGLTKRNIMMAAAVIPYLWVRLIRIPYILLY
jgi:hypothetical protein